MQIKELSLPGLLLVTPEVHKDSRGSFSETFRLDKFIKAADAEFEFVQNNLAHSKAEGTLRGLHFQSPPKAQGKLVNCIRGEILDIVVDIRVGSPKFGKHEAVSLNSTKKQSLWVPPGFLHGYVTTQPDTIVHYSVTDYYAPDHEGVVLWSDLDLNIPWQIKGLELTVSRKDAEGIKFRDFKSPFTYK